MKGGDDMNCGGTFSAGTDSYTINVGSFDWGI